ncbi:MAG: hypothetical protein RL571_2569 [Pseudomonadota bacterium]|jgi:hypothetical protein
MQCAYVLKWTFVHTNTALAVEARKLQMATYLRRNLCRHDCFFADSYQFIHPFLSAAATRAYAFIQWNWVAGNESKAAAQ